VKRKWSSEVKVDGATGYLFITSTDGESITHLFDAELAGEVAAHRWFPAATGEYAGTRLDGRQTTYYLHWLALGMPGGHGLKVHVDHINQKPMDSRRVNLRVVPSRINHHNQRRQSSAGVCIQRDARGYFRVRVRFANERIFHPGFCLLSDAERCRDDFLAIAQAVDRGLRQAPNKSELKAISDRIRVPYKRIKKAQR
jgi:hypothetical protein